MPYHIRISSACSEDWDSMSGDERARYCRHCDREVFNFSVLTRMEIDALIRERHGKLCGRYEQRHDGGMITRELPDSAPPVMASASLRASATLTALLSFGTVLGATAHQKRYDGVLQVQAAAKGLQLVVVDPSGAVIPGASVHLLNEANALETQGKTGADGSFASDSLPDGKYTVQVSEPGFNTFRASGFVIPFRGQIELKVAAYSGPVVAGPKQSPLPLATDQSGLLASHSSNAREILQVFDVSGAAIAYANVTLTKERTGETFSGQTASDGFLQLANLPHGNYRVDITSTGFASFHADHVSLPSHKAPQYALRIGALMGEVVVVDHRNPVTKLFSRLRRVLSTYLA
jgi:hypothetical protein